MRAGPVAAAAIAGLAASKALARVMARRRLQQQPIIVPGDQITWQSLPGAPPEVLFCTLWGDVRTGPWGGFIKFAPGFFAPTHTHSSDGRIVVVSGAFLYGPDGEPVHRLGPGSYFVIPGGSRHTTGADPEAGCVFYEEQPRGFDLNFVS